MSTRSKKKPTQRPRKPRRGVAKPTIRQRGLSPLTPPIDDNRGLLLKLVMEFQQTGMEYLKALGIPRDEQLALYRQALQSRRQGARPSAELLERTFAIADLVSHWRRDRHYVSPNGAPRVLSIKGKGATLQSLARKFVPSMPLDEVVGALTRHGDAKLHGKDRVSLGGGNFVRAPTSREMTLASLITRFRRVASTVLVNSSLTDGKKDFGRFEREVNGVLSKRAFVKYARGLRPSLQDVCHQAEAGLGLADRKGRRGKRCGIGIYIFCDD